MLSNFAWLRGSRPPDDPNALTLRPARQDEMERALRLILASSSGHADPAHVRDFLRLAEAHHSQTGGLWLAEQAGHLVSALLPIASPGRTMLIFPPSFHADEFQQQATRRLIEHACHHAAGHLGTHLVQALIDPHHTQLQQLLEAAGFKRLAELLYMQATIPRSVREPLLPAGFRWKLYSFETHGLFARAILETYQESLDCPALNGLRDIEDILAGHHATGQFDPHLWFVLCDDQTPAGVLLLSPIAPSGTVELVYLGVVPSYRGRGISDLLMNRAAAAVAATHNTRLSLAVDAENLPALKLYWRHGLQAGNRKVALLRDLRTTPPAQTPSPASGET